MHVDGLRIPDALVAAIDAGRWPRTVEEANRQNLHSAVPAERIRRLAPEEDWLYLYPPPFKTVAQVMGVADFYACYGAIDQIVPKAAIEIADFGIGSDAPILLDYRNGPTDPQVIRLQWVGRGQPNRWVLMAPNLESFIEGLGLGAPGPA